jgi:large subunit ribosomal protein L29
MALPEITSLRSLSDSEISDQISGARRELFDLRFQQATSRLEKPHRFRHARLKLAQLLTVQKERSSSVAAL